MGCELLYGNIENAYLCVETEEKLFTHSDEIFYQIVYAKMGAAVKLIKAQYGTKDSGHAWWVLVSDTLRGSGWSRSKGNPYIWYRPFGDNSYEHVGTQINDIMLMSK